MKYLPNLYAWNLTSSGKFPVLGPYQSLLPAEWPSCGYILTVIKILHEKERDIRGQKLLPIITML